MKKITQIIRIEQAIPRKGEWFDYYGDIFVSVVPVHNRSHIRRKVVIQDGKKDNKMSEWHLKWQYEFIEGKYGVPVSGKKTYEIEINVNGETHRIDSLVLDAIAIEFQHTLSVDLDEMDSRAKAHKSGAFLPYLVIDLTEFKHIDFQNDNNTLSRKLKKWRSSKYYKLSNLFIDFEDKMVRLSSEVIDGYVQYKRVDFIDRLMDLEDDLLKYKEEKRLISIELEKQRAEDELRKNEWAEFYAQRDRQEIRDENRTAKFADPNFEYFRRCYRNKVIRPYVLKYAKDFFDNKTSNKDFGKHQQNKYHLYSSRDNEFQIQYINVMKVVRIRPTSWRISIKAEIIREFKYAIVRLYVGEPLKLAHEFKIDGNTTIKTK